MESKTKSGTCGKDKPREIYSRVLTTTLTRYWLYVFAIIIILPANSSLAKIIIENEPKQEESAANAERDGEVQDIDPIALSPALEGIEAAIRDLIAIEDKIAVEAQGSRETRDLEAQEGMAKWAEWVFYATAATVGLTLAALFAIIRTLH